MTLDWDDKVRKVSEYIPGASYLRTVLGTPATLLYSGAKALGSKIKGGAKKLWGWFKRKKRKWFKSKSGEYDKLEQSSNDCEKQPERRSEAVY